MFKMVLIWVRNILQQETLYNLNKESNDFNIEITKYLSA